MAKKSMVVHDPIQRDVPGIAVREGESFILHHVVAYRNYWKDELKEWKDISTQLGAILKRDWTYLGSMAWIDFIQYLENMCRMCQGELMEKFHYDVCTGQCVNMEAWPITFEQGLEWTAYVETWILYASMLQGMDSQSQRLLKEVDEKFGPGDVDYEGGPKWEKWLYEKGVQQQAVYVKVVNSIASYVDVIPQITAFRMANSQDPALRADATYSLAGWAAHFLPSRKLHRCPDLMRGLASVSPRGIGDHRELQIQLPGVMLKAYEDCLPDEQHPDRRITTRLLWNAALRIISKQDVRPEITWQKDNVKYKEEVTIGSFEKQIEDDEDSTSQDISLDMSREAIRLGMGDKDGPAPAEPPTPKDVHAARAAIQSFNERLTIDDKLLHRLADIGMLGAPGTAPGLVVLRGKEFAPKIIGEALRMPKSTVYRNLGNLDNFGETHKHLLRKLQDDLEDYRIKLERGQN